MCEVVRLNNGKILRTPDELRQHFRVRKSFVRHEGDEAKIDWQNGCLCQVDLEKVIKQRGNGNFKYHCGDWWEVNKNGKDDSLINSCLEEIKTSGNVNIESLLAEMDKKDGLSVIK